MPPPRKKSPPRKRNLAAKALRTPLFRPRVMANPNAYKRRKRFAEQLDNEPGDDQMN